MRDRGTGQHKSQRASYCQHGRQQADPACNPPCRCLVADDAIGNGERGTTYALQDAAEDEHVNQTSNGTHHAADKHATKHSQEHRPPRRSARRPSIGVAIAELSRKAANTKAAAPCVVCKSR
jgi:hypothetical protein